MCPHMLRGDSWPPTPEDIPEPSHGRVFREKFRSVYVVKGVWSLLTDLFLNRWNNNVVNFFNIKTTQRYFIRELITS